MDLTDGVRDLAKRANVGKQTAQTEEATKNATVLPFLRMLGFDVFDIRQVIPEYTADVGVKKGEKVDYALKINDEIKMLVEAKPINTELSEAQYTQLYRYFSVEDVRISLLTNGRQYWFFSDIDEPNKMDRLPFFMFDLESFDDADIKELAKFHREKFNLEAILSTAANMKYTHAAARYLNSQMRDPEDEFVKLIGRQFYDGNMTRTAIEQLRNPVISAFEQIIRDRIQDRLQVAFQSEGDAHAGGSEGDEVEGDDLEESEIETTEEEWQGFYIVRAIASNVLEEVDRVTIRDQKSYCSIILDDNNRQPICRLWFNSQKVKHIGLFDEGKNEDKNKIKKVTDIYKYKEKIQETIKRYI
ncbi:type I restriction endonuclease [Fodinicurvata fenggangensis]|uniref:type I restriction endonuclease n=1 Tax=Fodinicurvata fenggangensis TaxID=1121830 RepID=UPI0009DD7996|nr:type I restriction endonuclease [Fodinicurvata fenggangensis]